jgi:hypothetical protein
MSDITSDYSTDSSEDDILLPPIIPVAIMAAVMEEEELQEQEEASTSACAHATEAAMAVLSARLFQDQQPNTCKRVYIKYDCKRSRAAVIQDYFGPTPIFNDQQFERFFWISKGIAQIILEECGRINLFFRDGIDASNRRSICVKVKFLMALKCLTFGVSPACFQDSFQMGELTGILCIKHFCRVLCQQGLFRQTYLRQMSHFDAIRVTGLHKQQHGIDGLIGSLDCMHIQW